MPKQALHFVQLQTNIASLVDFWGFFCKCFIKIIYKEYKYEDSNLYSLYILYSTTFKILYPITTELIGVSFLKGGMGWGCSL